MHERAIPYAVTALGVLAAWVAAPRAGFVPFLWVALLLLVLWAPPEERTFGSAAVLAGGLGILLIGQMVAWDRQLSVPIAATFAAAALLFGLARRFPPGDGAVRAFAVAVAATAVVALVQLATGFRSGLAGVDALPPWLRQTAVERFELGRAFGTAALPGHFAVLLVMVAPLLVPLLRERSGVRRSIGAVSLALVVAGVVATQSLAVAGIGLLLLGAVFLRGGGIRRTVLVGAVGVAVLAAVVLLRLDQVAALQPVRLRWQNWQATVAVFAAHPWLGVGPGGVGQAALATPAGAINTTPYAHNTLLQLLAEFGVMGLGLVAAGIVGLVRLLRGAAATELPLVLAVAVVPVHNLVDFSLYAPEVVLPWAVLAGTLAGRAGPRPRRPLSAWLLVPVLVAGAVVTTLGWKGEVELRDAVGGDVGQQVTGALEAARWAPWDLSALETATSAALTADRRSQLVAVDDALARRWWVRPHSSAYAEARARLLLAAGQRAEALVWAREAVRRAPWRSQLVTLEKACAASR